MGPACIFKRQQRNNNSNFNSNNTAVNSRNRNRSRIGAAVVLGIGVYLGEVTFDRSGSGSVGKWGGVRGISLPDPQAVTNLGGNQIAAALTALLLLLYVPPSTVCVQGREGRRRGGGCCPRLAHLLSIYPSPYPSLCHHCLIGLASGGNMLC
jgi:hypothetical protein